MRTAAGHLSKRALVAGGLRLSGVGALLRRLAPWRGALVLSYHRIGEASKLETDRSLFSATAHSLDEQLRFLTRHCEVIDPSDLGPELLTQRGRRVLITFDDGYRDLYETAYPVLQANRVRAAMFLCSGFIDGFADAWWDEVAWIMRHSPLRMLPSGPWSAEPLALDEQSIEHSIFAVARKCWELSPQETAQLLEGLAIVSGAGRRPTDDSAEDWITWEMAREMSGAGHQIGAHTVNHLILAKLAPERQYEEIAGSADRIEAELGERPRWFAYPVGVPGVFDEHSRAAAAKAGVELAFSNYGGRVTEDTFFALDVQRTSAERLRTPTLFAATVTVPALFAR